METAIIIVLLFMLLIAVIILLDINFDRKAYKIIIQDCSAALDKSKKENEKLKSKIADLKIQNDYQYKEYYKNINSKESTIDFRESKISELETKYKSSLDKIVERDKVIRLKDSEIYKYDKCNKQIAEDLRKKNILIEDSFTLVKSLEKEKEASINQSKKAIKLYNEMVKKFKDINLELESIESELKSKLNP
jgi:hypothetical protein